LKKETKVTADALTTASFISNAYEYVGFMV